MNESNIVEFAGRDAIADPLTELLRKCARELLQSAVEAELEVFMARFQDRKTPDGHAAVVRNGHHPERAVQTGIGPVTVPEHSQEVILMPQGISYKALYRVTDLGKGKCNAACFFVFDCLCVRVVCFTNNAGVCG